MKQNFKAIMVFAIALLTVTACTNNKNKSSEAVVETETVEVVDTHTAQNSLSWDGVYKGTLPCADCEGIQTELTLNTDETYKLVTTYLGKGDGNTFTKEGKFSWVDGFKIKLDGFAEGEGSSLYRVEEGKVLSLDLEGNVIEGNLAEMYILTQE